jgi:hypothetical protein
MTITQVMCVGYCANIATQHLEWQRTVSGD